MILSSFGLWTKVLGIVRLVCKLSVLFLSIFNWYSIDIFDENIMLKLVGIILLLEPFFAVDFHDFIDQSESLLVLLGQFVKPRCEFWKEALFEYSIDDLE